MLEDKDGNVVGTDSQEYDTLGIGEQIGGDVTKIYIGTFFPRSPNLTEESAAMFPQVAHWRIWLELSTTSSSLWQWWASLLVSLAWDLCPSFGTSASMKVYSLLCSLWIEDIWYLRRISWQHVDVGNWTGLFELQFDWFLQIRPCSCDSSWSAGKRASGGRALQMFQWDSMGRSWKCFPICQSKRSKTWEDVRRSQTMSNQ